MVKSGLYCINLLGVFVRRIVPIILISLLQQYQWKKKRNSIWLLSLNEIMWNEAKTGKICPRKENDDGD